MTALGARRRRHFPAQGLSGRYYYVAAAFLRCAFAAGKVARYVSDIACKHLFMFINAVSHVPDIAICFLLPVIAVVAADGLFWSDSVWFCAGE